MILIEIQPAGNAVAHGKYHIQRTDSQPWRAFPLFEGNLYHIVAKQLVSICIAPRWSQVESQDA